MSDIIQTTETVRRERAPTVTEIAADPMAMVAAAVRQGVPIEQLDKLLALQERWEANRARTAFTTAMAKFKANPPEILKRKLVKFTSERTNQTTEYRHATLGDVCGAITKGLAEVGISHRWQTVQADGKVRVTCWLTHELGHMESATLESAPDTSGLKNSIQAVASAVTYLQRYTLLAVSGSATQDMDDDGHDAEKTGLPTEYLSDSQLADLKALITEHNCDIRKLLEHWKLQKLADIPAANYPACIAEIKAVVARREIKAAGK